jgi:hypothetical protein
MKNSVRFLALYLLFALFQPVNAQIDFPSGSTFKYLKGNATTATPAELLAPTFNDASWVTAPSPFRYGKGTGGTELTDMKNVYSTFFLRTSFTAQKAEYIKTITFSIDYDDAFVLVINGKTALSVNTPAVLTTTSFALANHDPGTRVTFTADATKLGLVNGINTIAVMVLNVTIASSDILFDVQMSAVPETPPFDYSSNVVFSHQGGFYNDPFSLTLTSPLPDCNILYTYDGSDPLTSKTSILAGSTVSFTVDPGQPIGRGTTPGYVVRASLVKTGFAPSRSVTNSYIFLNKVKTQSYPGGKWPSAAINGQVLDYAMASDVVTNALYSPYLETALKQIPTISIVTDMDNLFNTSTGIYVNAAQSGTAWERPCSVELIDTNSVQKFQINAGLRIRGAASKGGDNPKHAFRFYFKDEYGPKKLYYPLFEEEGADEFDCIDLRCEQNYSWSKDGSKYNSLVADVFSRDLQGKMGQPYKRGRYYHLFLNGMYWGIFQTDERAEADYAESYLGGNSEDYDVVKVNSDQWPYYDEVTDGLIDTWSALWTKCATGFDTNANYFTLLGEKADGSPDPNGKVWVDVDNLIDYMLVIFYTGNFDAPVSAFYSDDMPNNFYALYNRNDKTKGFRFLTHDSEHSLFVDALYGAGIQENRVSIGTNGRMSITKMTDFNPQWLHFKLAKNAEYRARFIDRAYQQLTKGGLLYPENAANLYKSRAAQIDQAIIAESARWGDAKTSPSLTKATWQTQIQSMYTSFFPQRTDILKQQLLAEGLYTSVLTPDVSIDGTTFYERYKSFTGTKTLRLFEQNWMASGNSFYYTLDDSDPRLVGGTVSANAKLGKGAIELTLNQTTILNTRLYKSGVWGPLKKVVFSNADEDYSKLKVTELNYHPQDSIIGTDTISGSDFEFIEFKNTGTTAIDLSGLRLDSAILYQFPDEKLLHPGEFFVVASKPNIFFSKYKQYPSGNFSKSLSNSGEEVILFNKYNKPVLNFLYDDNAPWPTTPDGDGFTLTSKYANPINSPNSYDYWMASSFINGSPFADDYNALTDLNSGTDMAEKILVYPNPTNGVFYVNAGQLTQGAHYQVSIYDTKGSMILRNQFEHTVVIDLNQQNVHEGVYIVKVQTPTKMVTQKIIYLH